MSKIVPKSNKSAPLPNEAKVPQPETGYGDHRLYTGQQVIHASKQDSGESICTNCGAICVEKHWSIDIDKAQNILQGDHIRDVLCPGCKKIKEQIHCGEVIIEGSFSPADKEAFLRIVKHTEEKSWLRNPMSKITSILNEKDRIEIQTTTALLAERIGKELDKFHKGKLEIKRSPGEKFTRVLWLCE